MSPEQLWTSTPDKQRHSELVTERRQWWQFWLPKQWLEERRFVADYRTKRFRLIAKIRR